jgi:hypothetical protein
MSHTQADIQNIVNGLINRFSGQRIAFPNGQYHGECTAPIVWYLQELGCPVPGMANNRADGWGVVFPWQLQEFFTHEPYQPGKAYPPGSIPMWNSPHIAIVLSSDGSNTIQVFQQNADPNGAPCQVNQRVVNNSIRQCTFVLIPRTVAPTPQYPYRIEDIDPRRMVIAVPSHMYALNYHSLADIQANPDHAVQPSSEPFTVTAVLYHNTGKHYYLPEGFLRSNPLGYDAEDCLPYVPKPAYQPPAAPVAFPHSDDYYTVWDTLIAYKSSNDALNDQNGQGIVKPGFKYYVFNKRKAIDSERWAYNVTLVKGQAGAWIDESKNRRAERSPVPYITNVPAAVAVQPPEPAPVAVPEPEPIPAPVEPPPLPILPPSDTPEQIRASYQPFLTNDKPISARVKADVMVTELLHQGKPFLVRAGWPLHLYGVVRKNEQLYAVCRPKNQPLPPNGPDLYAIAINSRSDFSPSLREVSGLIENMRLEYENIHYSVSKSKLARTIDGVTKAILTTKK